MKLKVYLYGTLGNRIHDYEHSKGIEVEIPDGATVNDLLASLEISQSQKIVVVMEGRVRKADDKIRQGVPVSIFQSIHGG
jgi:sulfur carrier protein ThiS